MNTTTTTARVLTTVDEAAAWRDRRDAEAREKARRALARRNNWEAVHGFGRAAMERALGRMFHGLKTTTA